MGPRTLRGPRTQDPMKTQDPMRTQDLMRTQDPIRTQDTSRTQESTRTRNPMRTQDPGNYKLAKVSWFPHHLFNLVEFTIKDRFIYHCWMQINLKNFCKTKNMLEIKREELWILTIFSSGKNRCYNCYMQLTDK